MRRSIRLGLLAVAGGAALVFAGVALAAYSPALTVSQGVTESGGATTDITFAQTQADDPTARVVILAPAGFTETLDQAVGTQLGSLDGHVFAAELSAVVPVSGPITVADKSSPQLQAAATQCTGSPDHAAIWILAVSAAGSTLNVPAYVDPAPATLPFASARIIFCLSHPSTVVFKIRLLDATLHIANVFTPPSAPGSYRWTSVNTPWDPDNPTINAAGTIETQSIERTPVETSFSAKLVTKTKRVRHGRHVDLLYSYSAKLTGTVTAGNDPASDANVDLFAGAKKIATLTTNGGGGFTKTVALKATTTFHATIAQDSQTVPGGACVPPLPAGPGVDLPCGAITQSGFHETTDNKTVKKPKRKKKRIH
jgi:hypothetical protein